jgi:hypothetical protein
MIFKIIELMTMGDLLQLPFPGPGTLFISSTNSVIKRDLHDFSNLLLPLHLDFLLSDRWSFDHNLTQTSNLGMRMIESLILESLTCFLAGIEKCME